MKSIVALAAGIALAAPIHGQSFQSGFESGYEGWIADFADYPVVDSVAWHLKHSIEAMPGTDPAQNGLRMSGDNFSDDLFLFIRKKVTGLVPNGAYRMSVSVGIVTSQCPDCIGGDSFFLKAGATPGEPKKVVGDAGMYRMNIDKGNQARGGADMDTLGFVQHGIPGDSHPHLARFGNAKHPFNLKADGRGETWVIIGVESAFETPVTWNLADVSVEFAAPTAAFDRERVSAPPDPGVVGISRGRIITGTHAWTARGESLGEKN